MENYGSVDLNFILSNILEQIVKHKICKTLEKNATITRSHHEFVKNKSCQINYLSFYGQMMNLVNAGNIVNTSIFI